MAIYLEAHVLSFLFEQISYQRETIPNIDIVVATWKLEKNMPKPKGLVCYCLEADALIFVLIMELPLPSHGAILPNPVHAI